MSSFHGLLSVPSPGRVSNPEETLQNCQCYPHNQMGGLEVTRLGNPKKL
uniref:Uncharacterized protein n=1 Tax=Anguilla anguilla TaxID=7936 RepID=A0A0E9V2S2_ANGAN